MTSVAASRRDIASESARRLNSADAADSMAHGRPCPAMSATAYPSARPRCHKTVIKLSFQAFARHPGAQFYDPANEMS